jgi:hypothetical protein
MMVPPRSVEAWLREISKNTLYDIAFVSRDPGGHPAKKFKCRFPSLAIRKKEDAMAHDDHPQKRQASCMAS